MVLGLLGGVVGGLLVYFGLNGYQASTLNWASFSQITFAFTVTPRLLVTGLIYALILGLVGGLLPGLRAARHAGDGGPEGTVNGMQTAGARRRRMAADNPLQMTLWSEREARRPAGTCGSAAARGACRCASSPAAGSRSSCRPGVGIPAVERFVARHRDWAERRSRELRAAGAAGGRPPTGSRRRSALLERSLARGVPAGPYRPASMRDRGGALRVQHARRGTDRHVGEALVRWLSREAATHLRERLDAVAARNRHRLLAAARCAASARAGAVARRPARSA